MPVINFTQADVLKGKMLDEGWYGMTITKIDGPKQSKAGDSVNFDFYFTLDEKSPAPGKELIRTFNSKAIGMMIPLVAAVREAAVPTEGFQLDTDELLFKKVDGHVTVDTYNGQLKNIVEEYLPYGKGANKANPF